MIRFGGSTEELVYMDRVYEELIETDVTWTCVLDGDNFRPTHLSLSSGVSS